MKVLISDNISTKGIEILKKAGLDVDVKPGMKPEELMAVIGDYHGLVVRSATKATSKIIDAASNLKVIGRAGSGLDNVDVTAATKKGIVVMNAPGGNTITTAEHSFALMCSMARQIPQATASMKEGKWEEARKHLEESNRYLRVVVKYLPEDEAYRNVYGDVMVIFLPNLLRADNDLKLVTVYKNLGNDKGIAELKGDGENYLAESLRSVKTEWAYQIKKGFEDEFPKK